MKIICVEYKRIALWSLLRKVRRLKPKAIVYGFRSPDMAISLAIHQGCDVLLTNTDLTRTHMDGFMLAEKIKKVNPCVNIILISEHPSNREAAAAFRLRASGYIEKPYSIQRLAEEFDNLHYQVE